MGDSLSSDRSVKDVRLLSADVFTDISRRVFQSLSLGLVVFDPQLRIVWHNPAAAFLVEGHESISTALTDGTVDASYQDWTRVLREVIDAGRQRRFDQVVCHSRRSGASGEMLLNLQFIPLTEGGDVPITGGTLVIEDVTAAVSMEKRLAVSERMAAVGKLAARVAHELNNPLDGIMRYLNLVKRAAATGAGDKLNDYLDRARGGLIRMTDIVRDLVEFSRSAYTAFNDAGINTIVEEAVKVMSDKAIQSGVSIVCQLEEGLPAIHGTSLFQVFCNMIKNAVDAMPEGGTLTVATRTVDRHVIIRFEDTGIGLPEEMGRIFEPFFTTKEPGKGTGLGLAICKDIIEKYNGRIVPERREGAGTVFTIQIPLESCSPQRSSSPLAVPPGGEQVTLGGVGGQKSAPRDADPGRSTGRQDE
ncbi:MAG: GHKL domain-containing protein [Phycisphaerae bacterium]|nr:GHKL domain-containing protein [Phycisphaerae bacterium]